jgi:heat-inducible transcriptional repressor
MAEELSDRERTVLRYLVHDFIETASPIGSRYISKRHEDVLGLSSASIRNVMSDLEERGYLDHPHTSAGRVPTDLGYRVYLDTLMRLENVSESEQRAIRENMEAAIEVDELLKETTKLLGKISRQLSVVTPPHLNSGTFEKLELIQITPSRIMVILSIKSGLVRTIMMEVASEIRRERLENIARFLNERLSGLTLQEIRETFQERVKDAQNEQTGLIRLFIDSVDKLFTPGRTEKLLIGGTENIIDQPEFVNPQHFRSVIELINDEEIIIHVLERHDTKPLQIKVTIGSENDDDKLKAYTVITSTYTVGDIAGSIGLIGPKRMPYQRMIPLVDYVAKAVSDMFSDTSKTS